MGNAGQGNLKRLPALPKMHACSLKIRITTLPGKLGIWKYTHLTDNEEDDCHCCTSQSDEHQKLKPKNQPLFKEKWPWSQEQNPRNYIFENGQNKKKKAPNQKTHNQSPPQPTPILHWYN